MAQNAQTAQLPLPPALKVLRAVYPVIETLVPPLAKKIGIGFFLKPFKFSLPEREKAVANKASEFSFTYEGDYIQGYKWGNVSKSYIMVVHGWSGRAMQFHAVIEALLAKGFSVISFDARAHGRSAGKITDLVDIAGCLNHISEAYGSPKALIGHSLGGIACMYYQRNYKQALPQVVINSPAIPNEIFENYAYRLNGNKEKIEKWLRQYTIDKFGQDFDNASGQELSKGFPKVPFLICNDEDDREVSLKNQEVLLQNMPFAKTVTTQGLGHVRILRDEAFIAKIMDFVVNLKDA